MTIDKLERIAELLVERLRPDETLIVERRGGVVTIGLESGGWQIETSIQDGRSLVVCPALHHFTAAPRLESPAPTPPPEPATSSVGSTACWPAMDAAPGGD